MSHSRQSRPPYPLPINGRASASDMTAEQRIVSAPYCRLPIEIRWMIWDLLFIKTRKQDPDPKRRSLHDSADLHYPHMKGPIYLINSEGLREHYYFLSQKVHPADDKSQPQTKKSCCVALNISPRLRPKVPTPDLSKLLQSRLTYPSIENIRLHLKVNGWVRTDVELLTYVMTVIHAMRTMPSRKHDVNGVVPADQSLLLPCHKGTCEMVFSVRRPLKLLSKSGAIAHFMEDDEIGMALAALRHGCKNFRKAGGNM